MCQYFMTMHESFMTFTLATGTSELLPLECVVACELLVLPLDFKAITPPLPFFS